MRIDLVLRSSRRVTGRRAWRATKNPGFWITLVWPFLMILPAFAGEALRWEQLAPLPDAEGFAAPFAGVSGGALVVAGGANITARRWQPDFVKTWYDSAFVLDRPDGAWKRGFKLPRPCAYGVAVTTEQGVVCIDGAQHFDDVFLLRWKGGAIETTPLTKLPRPCANACGALVGRTIYLTGGIEAPSATTALRNFWALDLDAAALRWRELEPWPGPGRMLAVAGAADGAFYLFSGAKLTRGGDGKPQREYLRDAYRYAPDHGWKRLADLPRASVAAASPAPIRGSSLLIISGDDGANTSFEPLDRHPGFPRDVLAYDTQTDAWSIAGDAPFSRATMPAISWRGRIVIANGEVRPRVRAPEVWSLKLR